MHNAEELRHLLKSRGYIRIPSNGISMAPIIRTGDICQFEAIEDLSVLQVGDILLFVANSGELVGHRYHGRIVLNGKVLYICKGDFNRNADPPIAANQIVGRMTSIQNSKFHMYMDCFWMKVWGGAIVKLPLISVCIHYGMRLKRKVHWLKV
jgi:signal peptidase I